jgi:hypothetical protein
MGTEWNRSFPDAQPGYFAGARAQVVPKRDKTRQNATNRDIRPDFVSASQALSLSAFQLFPGARAGGGDKR